MFYDSSKVLTGKNSFSNVKNFNNNHFVKLSQFRSISDPYIYRIIYRIELSREYSYSE